MPNVLILMASMNEQEERRKFVEMLKKIAEFSLFLIIGWIVAVAIITSLH